MRLGLAATLVVAAVLLASFVPEAGDAEESAPGTLVIREWKVPYPSSRPRDPYVVGVDEVWFVGQRADYAGRFTPSTEEFKRFDLPKGSGPHNIIVTNDGTPFYAGNRDAHIGRLDSATGKVTRVEVKKTGYSDPHTLVFDRQGDIWFTLQSGNAVGRLTLADSKVTLIDVPTPSARPYGIKIDDRGTVWVAEFGSHKLATIDSGTLTLTEIPLPRKEARPRRLAVTSDGRIWYVDHNEGFLGRYDPQAGTFKEWKLPGGDAARPYGMAVDRDDMIWIVETGQKPNRFVGFDTGATRFSSITEIPSGGGSVRHMHYHAATGTVWFGTDHNTIGYAQVHERASEEK